MSPFFWELRMLKVAILGAVVLASGSFAWFGSGYCEGGACPLSAMKNAVMGGGSTVAVAAEAPATGPSTGGAEKVDVGNTKCVVMPDDEAGDITVEHQGKLYHLCCKGCVKTFKKDPEKYVKALEADPAKYGVKK